MAPKKEDQSRLRWVRLDNAAKIYPAVLRRNWSNLYRQSVTLTEDVDAAVLQRALEVTVPRFPTIAARLRRGVFWYYLQQIPQAPAIREEHSYPMVWMSRREMRRCAFRVVVYRSRIAVEFFHSLTDGNGALIFLKTLTAEYLEQKYGITVPAEEGVLDRRELPKPEELEDSFPKYAAPVTASRKERKAWRLWGEPQPGGFLHQVCMRLPVEAALKGARDRGVTLTVFLGAAMMMALQELQKEKEPFHRRKPIRLLIPVDLRKLFPSKTLRNFAMFTIPELDPRLGDYTFDEICTIIRHKIGLEVTPKHMSTVIATNVRDEQNLAVRLIPLPLKNMVMKAIFDTVGESQSCLSMSNLGAIRLPEVMKPYIRRMDFVLGVQAAAPYNCGILSYGDTLYINFIRNTRVAELERHFFEVLRDLGIPVTVESNQNER
ncbi:MAG: hypothetical protein E7455_07115 [Ruminococcaceae bacterium]|nr:hypothetical protein [Oscillospiraceae bacterium]